MAGRWVQEIRMNATGNNNTVGDWAARSFRCVLLVEKYGIDFHTEAEVALEEACRQRGLNAEAVRAELEAAAAPRQAAALDWNSMTVKDLILHIVERHHEYLKLELPRLRARLDRMAARHGERDGALLTRLHAVFCALQEDLEMHLHKEEMILFPAIERYEWCAQRGAAPGQSPFGTVRNPIRMMEREHDRVVELLREMREITRDYVPADYACANFRGVFASLAELEADLLQHIHLENDLLHPRAEALEKALVS
jgi:regulator of cell morphogenesis and NO signaling